MYVLYRDVLKPSYIIIITQKHIKYISQMIFTNLKSKTNQFVIAFVYYVLLQGESVGKLYACTNLVRNKGIESKFQYPSIYRRFCLNNK